MLKLFFSGHRHSNGLENTIVIEVKQTYRRRIGEQNCVLLLGVDDKLQDPVKYYILARVKDHMRAPEKTSTFTFTFSLNETRPSKRRK